MWTVCLPFCFIILCLNVNGKSKKQSESDGRDKETISVSRSITLFYLNAQWHFRNCWFRTKNSIPFNYITKIKNQKQKPKKKRNKKLIKWWFTYLLELRFSLPNPTNPFNRAANWSIKCWKRYLWVKKCRFPAKCQFSLINM